MYVPETMTCGSISERISNIVCVSGGYFAVFT